MRRQHQPHSTSIKWPVATATTGNRGEAGEVSNPARASAYTGPGVQEYLYGDRLSYRVDRIVENDWSGLVVLDVVPRILIDGNWYRAVHPT